MPTNINSVIGPLVFLGLLWSFGAGVGEGWGVGVGTGVGEGCAATVGTGVAAFANCGACPKQKKVNTIENTSKKIVSRLPRFRGRGWLTILDFKLLLTILLKAQKQLP